MPPNRDCRACVGIHTRGQNGTRIAAEDIEIGKEIEIGTGRGRPLRSLEVKQKERMFSAANN